MLQLENLTVGYLSRHERTEVATDISLNLKEGELICLIGPNGAGKSTLMRTLAAMQKPLAGRVMLRGQNIHQLDARSRAKLMGVVLTERATAGLLTATDVVALGRYPFTGWSGKLSSRDHEQVESALNSVGATALANRFVAELSDGERQRVMLARALAQEPALLVLDEITAFLDLSGRVSVMHLLRKIARDSNCGILVSTHDFELAVQISDKLWLVKGDLDVQEGCPEELAFRGAFDDLFSSEKLIFDSVRGVFKMAVTPGRKVRLLGAEHADEPALLWTNRLLERLGFQVCQRQDEMAEMDLRLPSATDSYWRLHANGRLQATANLSDLADIISAARSTSVTVPAESE